MKYRKKIGNGICYRLTNIKSFRNSTKIYLLCGKKKGECVVESDPVGNVSKIYNVDNKFIKYTSDGYVEWTCKYNDKSKVCKMLLDGSKITLKCGFVGKCNVVYNDGKEILLKEYKGKDIRNW
jgi:hypothetical protein